MRKLVFAALAVIVMAGCAVTDYPVILDSRGADGDGVLQSFYDKAYIIPTSSVATIWDDGSDELYSLVTQDWKGDQWLYTYNNFDPTAAVLHLDQTYCDPLRNDNCAIVTSWNPDVAGDDPFDYTADTGCAGYRSLSMMVTFNSRIGECGSGLWADKQGLAYEFGQLERATFRGEEYYHLPIDNSIASFALTGADGSQTVMPVFGRFNGYIDEKLRLALPVTPNAKFQLRWLDSYVQAHGNDIDMNVTYGALTSSFRVSVTTVQNALNRL